MAWLGLCNDDPLVKTLRDVFHANIIRVPEERMQPLCVLAARKQQLAYRGPLVDLLAGPAPAELATPPIETGAMADVSGRRTRKVSAEIGLDILKGFLSGFGVPVAADVAATLAGVSEVAFSFSAVERHFVSPARLGKLLMNLALDRHNPGRLHHPVEPKCDRPSAPPRITKSP